MASWACVLYSNDLGWHTCTWWWGPLGSLSIYRKLFISQSGHFCAPSALGFILERGPQKTFSFPLRIADGDALGVMQNQQKAASPCKLPHLGMHSFPSLHYLSFPCSAWHQHYPSPPALRLCYLFSRNIWLISPLWNILYCTFFFHTLDCLIQ